VREVRVVAPDRDLESRVRQVLAPPPEASCLLFPVGKAERKILRIPQVAAARVERELPGRLVVVVARRRPMAAVLLDGRWHLVAADGVVIEALGAGVAAPLDPRLQVFGVPLPAMVPGGRLSGEWLGLLLATASGVRSASWTRGLVLDCAQPLDLKCRAAGVTGLLGGPQDLANKTCLFARLVQGLQREGHQPAHVDVRIPGRPVWRPRQGDGQRSPTVPAGTLG